VLQVRGWPCVQWCAGCSARQRRAAMHREGGCGPRGLLPRRLQP
jgi:hypothetical protein